MFPLCPFTVSTSLLASTVLATIEYFVDFPKFYFLSKTSPSCLTYIDTVFILQLVIENRMVLAVHRNVGTVVHPTFKINVIWKVVHVPMAVRKVIECHFVKEVSMITLSLLNLYTG